MKKLVLTLRLCIVLVLLGVSLFAYFSPYDHVISENVERTLGDIGADPCPEERLCVTFLDVGQGDAIFIESPTGVQVLVDGGRDSSVLRGLGEEMDFFDKTIDYVFATHPDADHIGGLIDVLERYEIGAIIFTDNVSDSPVAEMFDEYVVIEGAILGRALRGNVYELGGGAEIEILFPDREVRDIESNTSSIIMQIRYGETEFLLTGDSPKSIEEYVLALDGESLESDVLKIGHHGSRTSTSEEFLSMVDPRFGVVSAGKDNSYGHPHKEVTDLLTSQGVDTKNTADLGSIRFISDGVTLEVDPL